MEQFDMTRLSFVKGKSVKLDGIESIKNPCHKIRIIIVDDEKQERVGEIELFQVKTKNFVEAAWYLACETRTRIEQIDPMFDIMSDGKYSKENFTADDLFMQDKFFNAIFLSEIWIYPEYQNKGIFKETLKNLPRIFWGLGVHSQYIFTLARPFDSDRMIRKDVSERLSNTIKQSEWFTQECPGGIFISDSCHRRTIKQ